jgi:hypothetical protein
MLRSAAVVALLAATAAGQTHTLSWRFDAGANGRGGCSDPAASCSVRLTLTRLAALGPYPFAPPPDGVAWDFGDGSGPAARATLALVGRDEVAEWEARVAEVTHAFPGAGAYHVVARACCRRADAANNAGGDVVLSVRVVVGPGG